MSTSKRTYSYALQARGETYELHAPGELKWFTLGGCSDVPLMWARGFMAARQEMNGPLLPLRILRSDGKIVEETAGKTEVSIGWIAGWPSAEQYERAAQRALATAAKIRQARKLDQEDEERARDAAIRARNDR